MKKYFVETNGYNSLVFVFDDNRAIAFDCETLEAAKNMDCSGIENSTDVEDAAINCNIDTDNIFTFDKSDSCWENVTEIA